MCDSGVGRDEVGVLGSEAGRGRGGSAPAESLAYKANKSWPAPACLLGSALFSEEDM